MNRKSELICNICKLILKDPVSLPCLHAICVEHLRDGTAKNGSIRCLKCEKDFDVPGSGFAANSALVNFLASESHLSNEEKTTKRAIQDLINQMEEFQHIVITSKMPEIELSTFDHFTEIRRQIDMQREKLKAKIDEIALKLIAQVKERENAYKLKVQQTISPIIKLYIQQMSQTLSLEFRKSNLLIEDAKRLQSEYEQKFKECKISLKEIDSLDGEIMSLGLEAASQELLGDSFGILNHSNRYIACSYGKMIKKWNLESNECVATLEGHTNGIFCLEKIDKNRFASGSLDRTIKIWDSKRYTCLKTLITDHQYGVKCIRSLTSNLIVSGSRGDIKIWNLDSGECLQILNGHSGWISDLVYLPNGNLVSCSDDTTIKVWDLARGECIKSIAGHSYGINCLLLLRDGQLASCSDDETIRIWNMESGECVKILQGHSHWVCRLEQLESGELVSCSADSTIKIWNFSEGTCIRTLVGHTASVRSIRVNIHNKTLVSCSSDKTIKTWNWNTGECLNTIVDENSTAGLIFV